MKRRELLLATLFSLLRSDLVHGRSEYESASAIPTKGDISLRSLVPRNKTVENLSTLEAAAQFNVTRIDWVYSLDKVFMLQAEKVVSSIGGALNPGIIDPASKIGEFETLYNIKDSNRNNLYAPWQRSFKQPWLCFRWPEVQESSVKAALGLISLGVRTLQWDDPAGNAATVAWGGCHCEMCEAGFVKKIMNLEPKLLLGFGSYREYLNDPTTKNAESAPKLEKMFSDFQHEIMQHYFVRLKTKLQESGTVLSFNNSGRFFDGLYSLADWWIGELSSEHGTFLKLAQTADRVREMGKIQMLTMPLKSQLKEDAAWRLQIRRCIATCFALGMPMQVPWDTYIPLPSAPRFFGSPRDYCDLYGFISSHKYLFDAQQYVGIAYQGKPLEKSSKVLMTLAAANNIYCVVTILEGSVLVHLLNWDDDTGDVSIELDASLLVDKLADFKPEVLFSDIGFIKNLEIDKELKTGKIEIKLPAPKIWSVLKLTPAYATSLNS